jgi:hypothetical protein
MLTETAEGISLAAYPTDDRTGYIPSYFFNSFIESEYNEVYKKMKMMKRLLQHSFSSVAAGV